MSFGEVMGAATAVIFGMTGEPAVYRRTASGTQIGVDATLNEPGREIVPGLPNYAAREQALEMEFARAPIDGEAPGTSTVLRDDTITFTAEASSQYRGRVFKIDSLLNVDADVITVRVEEVLA